MKYRNKRQESKNSFSGEAGISLLAMSFMILACGLFIAAGARLYGTWNIYNSAKVTADRMEVVQSSLQQYFAEHGRYPCPAPLTAAIDDGVAGFGFEVDTDCRNGAHAGTFRAAGRDGRMVRTGTVPVRTLGLADSNMFDGYKHRFIYAVTEDYAVDGLITRGDNGGIFVQDSNDIDATSTPGNVVQIVYSMGWDDNGSYNINGDLNQACNPALESGQNCDFATNAIFRNSVNRSTNENDLFVSRMSYQPVKTTKPCQDSTDMAGLPKDTVFLVDTSGSMGWAEGEGTDGFNVKCPAGMDGCSRIDVARWAMRRVLPSVVYQNTQSADSGQSSLTGFLQSGSGVTSYDIDNQLASTNIGYFDPDELTQDHDNDGELNNVDPDYLDFKNQQLETEITGMCPSGGTPLGVHIKSLADELGDGTSIRPNKITIISDGKSNDGDGDGSGGQFDPLAAANYIKANYPNVQVDIVDIVGNPELMQVSQITGGNYYRSDNPDALLKSLYSSLGVCEPFNPAPPVDQQGCGSKGGWWNNN